MNIKANKSANSFVTVLWSQHYFGTNCTHRDNIFRGQIRNVRTKENKLFDNVSQYLNILTAWHKAEEQYRKQNNQVRYNKKVDKNEIL